MSYGAAKAVLLRTEGKDREALAAAEKVLAELVPTRPADQGVKVAFPQALEAALALSERARAEELLTSIERLPSGRLAPSLRAHAGRFRARLAVNDGDTGKAEDAFVRAAATFREFGMPFWLAVTLTEYGESLVAEGRSGESEPMLAEARETFERLETTPWLDRVEAAATQSHTEVHA
jgi:hypothetical protein